MSRNQHRGRGLRLVLSGAASLWIAACSRSISTELPQQNLTVLNYVQGKISLRCALAPGTAKYRKLGDLLRENKDGWHHHSSDYTPSVVVIGGDLNLYFTEDTVVISDSRGEYSHSVDPDAYRFLNCKAT
jgi:hypothetical protein